MIRAVFYILFFLSVAMPCFAGELDELCLSLVKKVFVDTGKNMTGPVYLAVSPYSKDIKHYPFGGQLSSSMILALSQAGIKTSQSMSGAQVSLIVETSYEVADDRILVVVKVNRYDGKQFTVIAEKSDYIERKRLDSNLFNRGVDDIAEELAYSFSLSLPFKKVQFTVEDFKESGTNNTSEFGNVLLSKLKNILVQEYRWRVIQNAEQASALKGEYKVGQNFVSVSLQLLPEGVTAAVQCPKDMLSGYSLRPDNFGIVPAMDIATGGNMEKDEYFKARIVTNKEDAGNIFFNGDKLAINIVPLQDCYARVFYLQADGTVIQLYPNAYSGSERALQAGRSYSFPQANDRYELEITDSTLGQEVVIVYLSDQMIADDEVSKDIVGDSGLYDLKIKAQEIPAAVSRSVSRGVAIKKKKAKYNVFTKNIIIKGGK